jgi:hypothetical protein
LAAEGEPAPWAEALGQYFAPRELIKGVESVVGIAPEA